jgi:hypothetical protein
MGAQYKNKDGLKRQEMIVQVMERIITQQIPRQVINRSDYDWEPDNNKLFQSGREIKGEREEDIRYGHLKKIFQASQLLDPYYPAYPTHIRRSFESEREIPEKALEAHLVGLVTSPPIKKTAQLIEKRLGRPLRPFDIWYDGFRSPTAIPETELDRIVGERYPDCASFQKDLPNILMKVGFSKEKAVFLADHIQVDPSRGAGHAMGAARRGDRAHLRTRLQDGRFNYKGFNIALHELGHTVEQVFSLYCVDNTLLSGVPNTAFTEAFAFVFQSRDLEVLGLEKADPRKDALRALDTLWDTYELAGVALMDMKVWHWMYDHPDAMPAQLKEAVISCAKEVWNAYYAPVMGQKDVALFAIYSHMIESGLYLPNYPIGHIVQFQIEEHLKRKGLGAEMERMCSYGRVTPDLWMTNALGTPISAKPLIEESEKALNALGE